MRVEYTPGYGASHVTLLYCKREIHIYLNNT